MSRKDRRPRTLFVDESSRPAANNLNHLRERWFLRKTSEAEYDGNDQIPEPLCFPTDFEVELGAQNFSGFTSIEEALVWKKKLADERRRIEKWQGQVREYVKAQTIFIGELPVLQLKQASKQEELNYINEAQRCTNIWIERHSQKIDPKAPRYGATKRRSDI